MFDKEMKTLFIKRRLPRYWPTTVFFLGLMLYGLMCFTYASQASENPRYDILLQLTPFLAIAGHLIYPTKLGWFYTLAFGCFIAFLIIPTLFSELQRDYDDVDYVGLVAGFIYLVFATLPLLDKPLKVEPVDSPKPLSAAG